MAIRNENFSQILHYSNTGKEPGILPSRLAKLPLHYLYPNLIVILLLQIKTQKKYVWGKRESTEEGRPLGEVVEQVRNNNCFWLCLTFY